MKKDGKNKPFCKNLPTENFKKSVWKKEISCDTDKQKTSKKSEKNKGLQKKKKATQKNGRSVDIKPKAVQLKKLKIVKIMLHNGGNLTLKKCSLQK